jgi:MOSC domain-containing protein YiiM
VSGVDISAARVGERWRVGNAIVEVTKPRSPCWKLGVRMEDPAFPRRFRAAQRTGTYLAVVEEGDLGAGDPVEVVWRPAHPLTIGILAYLYEHDLNLAALAREAATKPLERDAWLEILQGGDVPEEHWSAWADEPRGADGVGGPRGAQTDATVSAEGSTP